MNRTWSHHEAMVIHVHDEVLAHNGQTNQCNVCSVKNGNKPINAGYDGNRVSAGNEQVI